MLMQRIGLWMCFLFLLHISGHAYANHQALRVDPFNTLPDSNTSTFRTDSRIFWDHEQAQLDGESVDPFIVSGGIHGTSPTLTSPAFSTVARVPERISQSSTIITYITSSNRSCWTIVSSDNDGITDWVRTGTTAYYHQCAASQPSLPANSAWLVEAVVTGCPTACAVTTVIDLREFSRNYSLAVNASRYTTFAAAVTALGTTAQRTLMVTRQETISANVSVPVNIQVIVGDRGSFNISSGITLTFARPIQAGWGQIFSGAGTVIFTNGVASPGVPGEWWGALCDNTGDHSTALQAALTAGRHLAVRDSTCRYATTLSIPDFGGIHGVGRGVSVLNYTGTGIAVDLPQITRNHVVIENVRISTTTGTVGIRLYGSLRITIDKNWIDGFSVAGIRMIGDATIARGAITVEITRNFITAQVGAGVAILADTTNDSNDVRITNNFLGNNAGGGIVATNQIRNWLIQGNDIEAVGGTGINISGPYAGLAINNNYFEGSAASCVTVNPSGLGQGLVVSGNHFACVTTGLFIGGGAGIQSGISVQGNRSVSPTWFIQVSNLANIRHYNFSGNQYDTNIRMVGTTLPIGIHTIIGDLENYIAYTGNHADYFGATPTLSACGVAPAIGGTDVVGRITIGTGVTTSCTVTFAQPSDGGNQFACTISGTSTAKTYARATTTTAMVITASVDMQSDVIDYRCDLWK